MSSRSLYLVLFACFYVSVLLVFFAGQIGFFLLGYFDLVFISDNILEADPALQGLYYHAYRDASPISMAIVKSGFIVWVGALVLSVGEIVYPSRLPFGLGVVTASFSGFLIFSIAAPVVMLGDKLPSGIVW